LVGGVLDSQVSENPRKEIFAGGFPQRNALGMDTYPGEKCQIDMQLIFGLNI